MRLMLSVVMLTAAAVWPGAAHAFCSVFDDGPCTPSFCSVFDPEPCMPEFDFPIGQDLRLTIGSRSREGRAAGAPAAKLNTLTHLFTALRGCWEPPGKDEARRGVQMSVRLSFKRSGELMGAPRWTYLTPGTGDEVRKTYRDGVIAALARCTPLPLTAGLGGALAGRPIAIRYVEDRSLE